MLPPTMPRPRLGLLAIALVLPILLGVLPTERAYGLITGSEGNEPITDPGWPKGAAAIANNPARIAWWEGPPFGGGQYHLEFRSDAKVLNAALADFAQIQTPNKRVVIHNGVGISSWIRARDSKSATPNNKFDWVFMTWRTATWDWQQKQMKVLGSINPKDAYQGLPAQIDVYTGGNLNWKDVVVPKGIEVDDQRLEAHGFLPADGLVLEGTVTDLKTAKPLAAHAQLEHIEPQPGGGYKYSHVRETTADAKGHWVLKQVPNGWHRVLLSADGYAPRVREYHTQSGQPGWQAMDSKLSKPGPLSGQVTDDSNNPLAGVEVFLMDVFSDDGGLYQGPQEYSVKTDAQGQFHFDSTPLGKASIWLRKQGYCRPGLGLTVATPAQDVTLKMTAAAGARIKVDFSGTIRPKAYIVEMRPQGGSMVGKWSGSGLIDAKDQITYHNVPPGTYVVRGHPNPTNAKEWTEPMTVELKGGEILNIKLPAKRGKVLPLSAIARRLPPRG